MFKFIRHLNVSRKLTLVCMAFLIPDFVLMCLFLVTINGYIDFAKHELIGNEYQRPLEDLLDYLPQHLQLARRSLAGDAECAQQLARVQEVVDSAFDRLTAVDARLGGLLQFTDEGLSQRHREQCRAASVALEWTNLKDRLPELDEAACEADHERLIANVRGMISHAGDTSNLILDPDLDSYYLMDVTLLALPQMQDRIGSVLLRGESCLRKGVVTSADQSQFKVDAAMLQEADLDRILASARTALNEDHNFNGTSDSLQRELPPALEKFNAAATSFIAMANSLAESNTPDIEPEQFVAAGTDALRASSDLWKVAVAELDGLLQSRIVHFQWRRASSLVLAAMAFTAAISLATFITRSISRPLERQADELRQANETIRESENRARAVIEAAPDCVITMDSAGNVVKFNQAAERMFHYKRDEAVGRAVAELIVPLHYRESHEKGLEHYLRTGEGPVLGRQVELEALRADGSTFPIEISISAMTQHGTPTFIAFIRDITQRKKSQDELKRLYAETELLLASISSVLIHLDSAGIVTRWNAAAESVFGLAAADAIGLCCRRLPWGDPDIPERLEDLAGKHGSERFLHVVVKRPDGEERVVDLSVNPICPGGQCTGLLVLGNDRTEQVQLEGSLRQAQKLESIGQLAAGIAHEINTPMQFVCDNIEFLSDCSEKLFEVVDSYKENLDAYLPEKIWVQRCRELEEIIERNRFNMLREQVPLAITESLEGARRVIHIVRAMKEFSHPGTQEKLDVDLNEAIRSTATISRNRWKYVADLELDLDPDLPRVQCLPAEINQVLLNLIVNAADAIGEEVGESGGEIGDITVRTRVRGGMVVIEVEDTGCGIPDEIRNRIFDPFFTTKDVGKGTGQGLAICYNVVVNSHQGVIEVESTPGVGTTFRVSLPIVSPSASAFNSNFEPAEPPVEDVII